MSDNTTIKVNTAKLVEVSGNVSGQIRRTRTAFSAIEKTINAAGGYWEGSGHDAFLRTYQQRLSRINEALARFEENVTDLQEIAGIYEQAEREVTDSSSPLPNEFIV